MQQQNTFLKKLQCILEVLSVLYQDQNNSHILSWLNEDQFIIINQSTFVTEILPKYFRHSNMQSFIRLLYKYKFRYFKKEKTRIISHYAFKRSRIMWNEFKFTKASINTLKELEAELIEQKNQIKTLQQQQFQLIKQINLEVNRCIALQIIMADFQNQQNKFFTDGRIACYPLVTFFVQLSKGFKQKTGYLNYLYQEFLPQRYQLFPWNEGEKIPEDMNDQLSLDHFSPLQFKFG